MTTSLTLLDIRDLLTDWETSPALNAAKHHEARALYAASDEIFSKRIVPADFARRLLADDPNGTVFFVQIKSIPATIFNHDDYRRWTPTAEYGVLWAAADWPKSTESRLQRVAHLTATGLEHFARQYEADRLTRMASKITKRVPALRNVLDILRANQHDETEVRAVIQTFERILNETFYEPPSEQRTSEPTGAGPQGPAAQDPQGSQSPDCRAPQEPTDSPAPGAPSPDRPEQSHDSAGESSSSPETLAYHAAPHQPS